MKNFWTELGLGYKIFGAVVIVGAVIIWIFGH
jgi:hypothetical protein